MCPYEFVTYWEPILLDYPLTIVDDQNDRLHAKLTDSGVAKLKSSASVRGELEAGIDYVVKEGIAGNWLPFPKHTSTNHFRNTWVLGRRRRPKAPSFAGAPLPVIMREMASVLR